jgi:hypothetical protein
MMTVASKAAIPRCDKEPTLTHQLEMEIPKTLWLKKHMAEDRFKGCQLFE